VSNSPPGHTDRASTRSSAELTTSRLNPLGCPLPGDANRRQTPKVSRVSTRDAAMPSIGTQVQVLRHSAGEGGVYQSAIVVGHLNDPELGNVIELRLSDSKRLQRTWPTSTIRLSPAA